MSEPPTLYEWVRGRPAIARLIDAFYDRVEGDDLLSPLFPGGVSAEHREHVTTWWCEMLGGPADYTRSRRLCVATDSVRQRAVGQGDECPGSACGYQREDGLSKIA